MSTFLAISDDGKFSLGSEANARRFRAFLQKNSGIRLRIEPITPESRDQRGFFEGGVVSLITYYQEGFDHRNNHDLKEIREWLKREFHGQFRVIAGKAVKMAKSTKGELNKGFLERVMDWMADQGYQVELLNPKEYKHWKDAVRPFEGPENYIDYLLAIGKLKPK